MTTYIEDLVQNIYTKCDMTGLDNLNSGLKDAIVYSSSLEQNLRQAYMAQKKGFDFHSQAINKSKEAYKIESLRQRLEYEQQNYRARLHEQQQKWDEARHQRQEKYNKSLNRQNLLLRRAGRLFLTYFGIRGFKSMFDTASRLQLVQKSIQGLTKSTQDWDFIQKQAFEKGIDIEVVAKGYRNFYSSAKMAGFDKGSIQQMYADMLLSTRAIGATTQQTEGALLALEQMISKGTVSMEELRRQLGNALPGAFEIGAKAMNMTTMEFNKFVREGQLASAEFVPKFIKQLKQEYAGGFKEVAETLSFATTRLSVAWKLFQKNVFEGETGKSFAFVIDSLARLLISPEFNKFTKILGKILELTMKILIFAINHIRTLLVLLGSGGLMFVFPKILGFLKMIGLGLAFITSTGVINGITALTASFWGMIAPFLALYSQILLTISALIILKDIYDTFAHPDWDTLTRREWEGKNTSFGASQTGLNPFGTPQTVKQKMQEYEKLKTRPMEMYSSPSPGLLNGGLFNKNETNDISISLGGININSNNSNPLQIAQAVQDQLIALFMGRGLVTNAQETVG